MDLQRHAHRGGVHVRCFGQPGVRREEAGERRRNESVGIAEPALLERSVEHFGAVDRPVAAIRQ